jgi:membrane associated rhomboid family serine protease
VSVESGSGLRVKLDLDAVWLFLLPLAAAAALVVAPVDALVRASLLVLGASVWAYAYVRAWALYREWIRAGARRPWFPPAQS